MRKVGLFIFLESGNEIQDSVKLVAILLLQLPKCYNYRHVSLYPILEFQPTVQVIFFFFSQGFSV